MTTQENDYDRESYILVVDDDDTLLKFFKIHLNKFFSKVVVVQSAKEAVVALKEKEIDFVISDIKMSKTDGMQFMKKVRNFNPSIPVFLISGALLNDDEIEAIDTKADGFLRKPFTIEELHDLINKGIKYREAYKELWEVVKEKRKFLELITGKRKPTQIRNEKERQRVVEIFENLEKSLQNTDNIAS